MIPEYDLDKIKFATDEATYNKAVNLYKNVKITQFKKDYNGYFAIVHGTSAYKVFIESNRYGYGECDCYLGQNETLCKHMVAVAIYAVKNGKPLNTKDEELIIQPNFSGRLGILDKEEFLVVKKQIADSIRYIKPYQGPSRIWFMYQDSLSEGCKRLSKIVSELPVSEQTAKLLVDMLIRLDDKLCGSGVDDSNGTVGSFIEGVVSVLEEYTKFDQKCAKAFSQLQGIETCFDWKESLVKKYSQLNTSSL